MKNRTFLSILLLIVCLAGCWSPKTIITTANITQPVLVGKVKTIGGEQTENTTFQKLSPFSAEIKNSDYYWSAGYSYGSTITREGSNKIDDQLLPVADQVKDSTAVLVVDSLRFKASGGYWLFVLNAVTKGSISGAKYSKK